MAAIVCPSCGLSNIPERQICKRCGTTLREGSQTMQILSPSTSILTRSSAATEAMSIEQRKISLEQEISKYIGLGYTLLNRTEVTAQLVMQRKANGCILILLLLIGIIPGLLYLNSAQGTDSIYIEVDEYGSVKITNNSN